MIAQKILTINLWPARLNCSWPTGTQITKSFVMSSSTEAHSEHPTLVLYQSALNPVKASESRFMSIFSMRYVN